MATSRQKGLLHGNIRDAVLEAGTNIIIDLGYTVDEVKRQQATRRYSDRREKTCSIEPRTADRLVDTNLDLQTRGVESVGKPLGAIMKTEIQ